MISGQQENFSRNLAARIFFPLLNAVQDIFFCFVTFFFFQYYSYARIFFIPFVLHTIFSSNKHLE